MMQHDTVHKTIHILLCDVYMCVRVCPDVYLCEVRGLFPASTLCRCPTSYPARLLSCFRVWTVSFWALRGRESHRSTVRPVGIGLCMALQNFLFRAATPVVEKGRKKRKEERRRKEGRKKGEGEEKGEGINGKEKTRRKKGEGRARKEGKARMERI